MIDDYSCNLCVKFFQFPGDHKIGYVCLSLHIKPFLQPLHVLLFEVLADA